MEFGVQLGIPMGTIEGFKVDYNNESGKIFHQIIHYLLTNTPESLWFEKVCSALEGVDNNVLANTVKSTYMKTSLTGKVIYLVNHFKENSTLPMCIDLRLCMLHLPRCYLSVCESYKLYLHRLPLKKRNIELRLPEFSFF